MYSSDLLPLINLLKEETKKFYTLQKRYFQEKIPQKKAIIKLDINDSIKTIDLIKLNIKANIEHYKKLIKLKLEILKETEIKNKLDKKAKKIKDFTNKGKKILINDIPYYEKMPEYANKKLKTAELSPLDLINFTLRLSQQSKAPLGGINYINNFIGSALISDKQNDYNIYSYYIKNKNRYLVPYPGDLEMKQSILRYDFSEEKRLLPPVLIEPDPKNVDQEGNIIANNGSSIKLKYPEQNRIEGITFKYSKDINILPSIFSGEEYKEYSQPMLDKNCIFKVCSCKKGFKDSKIITFKFYINMDIKVQYEIRKIGAEAGKDAITKKSERIDTNPELAFRPIQSSPLIQNSHGETIREGTSTYQPVYFEPGKEEEEEDDDEI